MQHTCSAVLCGLDSRSQLRKDSMRLTLSESLIMNFYSLVNVVEFDNLLAVSPKCAPLFHNKTPIISNHQEISGLDSEIPVHFATCEWLSPFKGWETVVLNVTCTLQGVCVYFHSDPFTCLSLLLTLSPDPSPEHPQLEPGLRRRCHLHCRTQAGLHGTDMSRSWLLYHDGQPLCHAIQLRGKTPPPPPPPK